MEENSLQCINNLLISIVVPVYNSYNNIHLLVEEIDNLITSNNWNCELLLIDDGSSDNSYFRISQLSKQYLFVKGVKLSRNFGQQIAIKTGLELAQGDLIAILDDDLQDPPSVLIDFIDKIQSGYDVVYGVRKKRKESLFKKMFYSMYYIILKRISKIDLPLDSGDFCIMNRKVVGIILSMNEKNLFLRGMRSWVGFNQIGVEYERSHRIGGESGYTLKKLIEIAKDGVFSFSIFPLKIITYTGVIGLLIAVFYSSVVFYYYFTEKNPVGGYTSLVLIIMFFSSLILISLSIIGEYLRRIFDETRNRPYTIIESKINFDNY